MRPGVRQKTLARQMHPALAQLDVAVLNYLIFEKVLGLDAKALDDQETFKYSSRLNEVVAAVTRREARLAFLLNPTRIEQVQEVATAGPAAAENLRKLSPASVAGKASRARRPRPAAKLPAGPGP